MISGKYAIITGASSRYGMGFEIAKMLIENGCKVLITGRNEKKLVETAKILGENAIPFVWDLEDSQNISANFKKAVELLGGLDIFVNNAGVVTKTSEWWWKTLLETPVEEFTKTIKVDLTAVFLTMKESVNYMIENKIEGHILNISSVAGAFEPAFGAYGASKSAVVNLTKGWGKMFARNHITINCIAPGPTATEMDGWKEGESLENPLVPYGRSASPKEIADLARYLLSDEAKMVCGETVVLDGSYSIR